MRRLQVLLETLTQEEIDIVRAYVGRLISSRPDNTAPGVPGCKFHTSGPSESEKLEAELEPRICGWDYPEPKPWDHNENNAVLTHTRE